jgi:hypothetical protein
MAKDFKTAADAPVTANYQPPAETPQETKPDGAQRASGKPAAFGGDNRHASGKQQKAAPAETTYSAADLANAARARFGVPPEIVTAALRLAGKQRATLTEARQIVTAFMERTVK